MAVLEQIEKNLEKSIELSAELIKKIEEFTTKNSSPIERFEVYINSTEVQRILSISEPVVRKLAACGLLSVRTAKSAANNRYSLSEIEWLKSKHYRQLNAEEMRALVKKKNLEYKGV